MNKEYCLLLDILFIIFHLIFIIAHIYYNIIQNRIMIIKRYNIS